MGMKKLLFGLLGLLFSISAHAGCNLFNPDTAVLGDIKSDGVIGELSHRIVSDFIPVVPGQKYVGSGQMYIANSGLRDFGPFITGYYNANKEFISGSRTVQSSQVITIPDGVSYARVEYGAPSNEVTAIVAQSKLQFEQGSTATAYEPYNPLCATCDGTVMNYTSATGTVTQNGTPTPTNPITPTFYTQGNMVLRKVGDYADTYDATTGKITRKVGVKVFDGTENWGVFSTGAYATNPYFSTSVTNLLVGGNQGTILFCNMLTSGNISSSTIYKVQYTGGGFFVQPSNDMLTVENFKSWLAQQYRAGTPLTIWYPLADEVVEDWPASQCQQNIRVATTKYVETEFNPLNTTLANAVATVNTVVTQTIAQAASIATLQSGKQTRPDETCPAGKKCLLVTDENNIPHWYEIVEPLLPAGYIQLQWIESTGTQFIDTGIMSYKNTDIVKTKINPSSIASTVFVTFQNPSEGTSNMGLFINETAQMMYQYGEAPRLSKYISSNTDYVIEATNGRMTINNETISGQQIAEITINNSLCIGAACNLSSVDYRKFRGRIYYFRYEDKEGNVLFDGIPCYRNSDNAIGMYDLVNDRFYTNAGTGTFTAGPVAE